MTQLPYPWDGTYIDSTFVYRREGDSFIKFDLVDAHIGYSYFREDYKEALRLAHQEEVMKEQFNNELRSLLTE